MDDSRRTAIRWALAGLGAHLVLVAALLLANGGNAQWFVHFGDEGSVLPLARQTFGDDLLVPHEDGHDGQAFWLLARDPLLLDADDNARYFDRPAYRSQRIAYPALAWPWRSAGEDALIWGLLLTNLVTVAVGAYAATRLAIEMGAPPRAGLAFALNPAVIAGVLIDGSDTLAIAAVVGAVLLIRRGRLGLAVAAAAVAVLAKEPMLLAFAGIAVLAPGLSGRARLALVTVPAAAAGAWALYVRWRLGWPPSQIQEFATPFYGYVDAYRRGWKPVGNWWDAVAAVALVPFAVAVLARWWRDRSLVMAAAVPYAAMVPFLSAQVLNLPGNALRAVGPAVTFLWLSAYVRASRSAPSTPPAAAPALAATS